MSVDLSVPEQPIETLPPQLCPTACTSANVKPWGLRLRDEQGFCDKTAMGSARRNSYTMTYKCVWRVVWARATR